MNPSFPYLNRSYREGGVGTSRKHIAPRATLWAGNNNTRTKAGYYSEP